VILWSPFRPFLYQLRKTKEKKRKNTTHVSASTRVKKPSNPERRDRLRTVRRANNVIFVNDLPSAVLERLQVLPLNHLVRLTGITHVLETGNVTTARASAATKLAIIRREQCAPRNMPAIHIADPTLTRDNYPSRVEYLVVRIPTGQQTPRPTQNGRTQSSFSSWRWPNITLTLYTTQWMTGSDLTALPGRVVCVTNLTCYPFPRESGKLTMKSTASSYIIDVNQLHPALKDQFQAYISAPAVATSADFLRRLRRYHVAQLQLYPAHHSTDF